MAAVQDTPANRAWAWEHWGIPWEHLQPVHFQQMEALTGGGTAPRGGSSASGNMLSPADLATTFRQPDVTLPDTDLAKQRLRELQLAGVGGFETLLGADPDAARKALRDAIYASAAEPINYEADRAKRSGFETMFGKNMGQSSVTGDYVIEPVERARSAALQRAANDAFVQANTLANQNRTTQAQILGQAFNEGTTGLQGEAGVEAANRAANQAATQAGYQTGIQTQENAANRAQQESQFGRTQAQQSTFFGQGLAQQKELQKLAFENASDIASKGNLAAGIGGGLTGLATLFAPAANNFLANQWPGLFGPVR